MGKLSLDAEWNMNIWFISRFGCKSVDLKEFCLSICILGQVVTGMCTNQYMRRQGLYFPSTCRALPNCNFKPGIACAILQREACTIFSRVDTFSYLQVRLAINCQNLAIYERVDCDSTGLNFLIQEIPPHVPKTSGRQRSFSKSGILY